MNTLPLSEAAVGILKEVQKHRLVKDCQYCFPNHQGGMRTGFWKNWMRIRNKAALPKKCMFHDLHHTFATYIASIEGERLDTDEAQSSIAKRLGIALSKDKPVGRDVEGIVEMVLDATQNYNQTLTVERLFDWHAALFPTGRSGMHRITVAAWRPAEAGPMQVVSGPTGYEKVHYKAPEASRLDAEMTNFFSWLEADLKLDPVLKAGIAHLWFVTIHPFEDGNGRIARAIADMPLTRADGTSHRFSSMSRQLEKERKE